MSMSGIQIPEEVIKKYEEKRFEKRPGGLVLKINEELVEIQHVVEDDFEGLQLKIPDEVSTEIRHSSNLKNLCDNLQYEIRNHSEERY